MGNKISVCTMAWSPDERGIEKTKGGGIPFIAPEEMKDCVTILVTKQPTKGTRGM